MKILNTVEDIIIFEGNDDEIIDFVRKIIIENKDYNYSVLGISDAIEYIEEYCDNLEIIY